MLQLQVCPDTPFPCTLAAFVLKQGRSEVLPFLHTERGFYNGYH